MRSSWSSQSAAWRSPSGPHRRKWGLPDGYPMVAPAYSRARSRIARSSSLDGPLGQIWRLGWSAPLGAR
ncbi:MucR family transcriptional regulator (plasmid) [Mesorhizobium sp. ORM8.1]